MTSLEILSRVQKSARNRPGTRPFSNGTDGVAEMTDQRSRKAAVEQVETENTQFEGEIRFLAENTDLSPGQARELIKRVGTDRGELMKAAKTVKAES